MIIFIKVERLLVQRAVFHYGFACSSPGLTVRHEGKCPKKPREMSREISKVKRMVDTAICHPDQMKRHVQKETSVVRSEDLQDYATVFSKDTMTKKKTPCLHKYSVISKTPTPLQKRNSMIIHVSSNPMTKKIKNP